MTWQKSWPAASRLLEVRSEEDFVAPRGSAIVVGGGIGGLCAAIALRKVGWEVTVLEQALEPAEVGAGITLWPNALRGLAALGLSDEIEPRMTSQLPGRLRDHRGRWLTAWDGDKIERELGGRMVGIHRAELLDLLLGALPDDTVQWGSSVDKVAADGKADVNGEWLAAEVVIGADGLHSGVRRALWPDPGLRYVGGTAFRAVVDMPQALELSGILGPGVEVGMVPLVDQRVYWFVSLKCESDTHHADPKQYLLQRFADWPDPFPVVIEQTPSDAILHHDLYALKESLDTYVNGHVVVIGDAAHAMPPYLGQGGCQAIEDAVELAAALASDSDVTTALKVYDRVRRPRSQAIAKQSWLVGRFGAKLSNPIAVASRNALIRLLPDAIAIRQAAQPTRWEPPAQEQNAEGRG